MSDSKFYVYVNPKAPLAVFMQEMDKLDPYTWPRP
jgi:hypothetical protein